MKVILCLALIAIGIYGLIAEYKRRSKEKMEILRKVLANYLIAKDALIRCDDLSSDDFQDAMNHLTNNTIDVVIMACGTKYIGEAYYFINTHNK